MDAKSDIRQQVYCLQINKAAGPISRILSAETFTVADRNLQRRPRTAGRPFLWAAHHCAALATYPKVVAHRAGTLPASRDPFLFGLAPCGVCHARYITAAAVRSYRTFSPLPRRRESFVARHHLVRCCR